MKRLLFVLAALFVMIVATASAGTVLYDPPAESGTVSYNAPAVDVPYTVNPPQVCNDPAAASGTVGGVDVTLDAPQVCVDPPAVSGTVSYDAAPVDVPFTIDPAPRNVSFPDQVAADCGDGLDNDADGQIDFPADGGCASATDTVEAPNAVCSDTLDNDGDGLTDFPADPGCKSVQDTGEFNAPAAVACADSVDNDGDGLTDMADPGCTDPSDTDETDPAPPPPGGGGGTQTGTVTLTNQKFTCDGLVDLDLVKVTVDDSHFVTPAVQIANGCTGNIDRIEIDNANGDGIHVGAFAHDLSVGGGFVHSPLGGCSLCGALHVDGIQVMGGQRITFHNMDVNYQTASNSALYINCGQSCQDRPTDVVFDGSTFARSVTQNRVVRIGDSLRSGIRNSTVYYCGSQSFCSSGAVGAPAIWGNNLATDPVGVTTDGTAFTGPTPDNTLILTSQN